MTSIHVKDIDEWLYSLLREKAKAENRSISQEVIIMLEKFLSHPSSFQTNPTPEFLSLSGAWIDKRPSEEIIRDIRKQRKNSNLFAKGHVLFD